MPLGLLLDVVEMPIDGLDPRRDGPTGLLGDFLLALDDVQRGRDQSRRPLRCPRAKAQRRRDPTGLLLDVVQLPPNSLNVVEMPTSPGSTTSIQLDDVVETARRG